MRWRSGAGGTARPLSLRPLALALLMLVAPMAALAQEAGPGPDLYLPDALVVGPDETLRLSPGTRVHGPGHVEVQGRLVAEGTAQSPVRLQVPVAVVDAGVLQLRDVHVDHIPGAAVTLRGGTIELERVSFADNRVGLVVAGGDRGPVLRGTNVTFERHEDAALRLSGRADASLTGAAFLDNLLAVHAALDSPGNATGLVVSQSRFERNDEHVVLDFGDARGEGRVRLDANAFSGGLRALVLRSTATEGNATDAEARTVALEDNLFRGATLGLAARGAGYVVDSRNDTFLDNRVGLSASGSLIRLVGTRFVSSERDLDLGPDAQVTFQGVSFAPTHLTAAPTAPSLMPVLVGALLAGGAGLAAFRARRTMRQAQAATAAFEEWPASDTAPSRDVPVAAPEEVAPAPVVSELETRILHDIGQFPGSPQIAIAQRLGLTRQALHYHVKKLVAAGLVEKTTVGRTTECRLAPGVQPPAWPVALPPSVTQSEVMEKG